MSLSDPNRPDEPHWIPLGVNEVRVSKKPIISIPNPLVELGVLEQVQDGSDAFHKGYWSYERENGWLLLGNQPLTNSRNRMRERLEDERIYEADGTGGDFKFADWYRHRQDGCLQIPDMFYTSPAAAESADAGFKVETIEDAQGKNWEVVPEYARVTEGEQRYFMTWSEWLTNDPKVAVLFRMDHLPFMEPDDIPGTGGNSPGPQFGTDEGGIEAPDIGLSN